MVEPAITKKKEVKKTSKALKLCEGNGYVKSFTTRHIQNSIRGCTLTIQLNDKSKIRIEFINSEKALSFQDYIQNWNDRKYIERLEMVYCPNESKEFRVKTRIQGNWIYRNFPDSKEAIEYFEEMENLIEDRDTGETEFHLYRYPDSVKQYWLNTPYSTIDFRFDAGTKFFF